MLDKEDLEELKSQLEKIKDSKQETSDRIRALIRELHRSPLGATGLGESLESFTDEVGRDPVSGSTTTCRTSTSPAPIALLIFHIAREGVMNALEARPSPATSDRRHEARGIIVLELRDTARGSTRPLQAPRVTSGWR